MKLQPWGVGSQADLASWVNWRQIIIADFQTTSLVLLKFKEHFEHFDPIILLYSRRGLRTSGLSFYRFLLLQTLSVSDPKCVAIFMSVPWLGWKWKEAGRARQKMDKGVNGASSGTRRRSHSQVSPSQSPVHHSNWIEINLKTQFDLTIPLYCIVSKKPTLMFV